MSKLCIYYQVQKHFKNKIIKQCYYQENLCIFPYAN